jgi:hypothetical protein
MHDPIRHYLEAVARHNVILAERFEALEKFSNGELSDKKMLAICLKAILSEQEMLIAKQEANV